MVYLTQYKIFIGDDKKNTISGVTFSFNKEEDCVLQLPVKDDVAHSAPFSEIYSFFYNLLTQVNCSERQSIAYFLCKISRNEHSDWQS